jgi:DNA repair exonuclease SbcCD ATPase subunit
MNEENPKPEPPNYTEEKARLECEKLKAEIETVRKPVYHTPSFYAAIAPVILAILGLIFTWSSGWFDVQHTRISNEKTLLEAENSKLSAQKEALTTETSQLETTRAALNERKNEEQQNIVLLTNQLNQLQRQRDEKEQLIQTLNTQITKLTQENQEAQTLVKQINKLQSDRDKAESQLIEIRSHLATAYERARIMLKESANAMQAAGNLTAHPDKYNDFIAASGSWVFAAGKWRAAYEGDIAQFSLSEFMTNTNASVNVISDLHSAK